MPDNTKRPSFSIDLKFTPGDNRKTTREEYRAGRSTARLKAMLQGRAWTPGAYAQYQDYQCRIKLRAETLAVVLRGTTTAEQALEQIKDLSLRTAMNALQAADHLIGLAGQAKEPTE